jgi:hypothetical protein
MSFTSSIAETERADVGDDLRDRLGESAVDQDVPDLEVSRMEVRPRGPT